MFSPISLKVKFKYGTSAWTWHGHSICITKPVMVSETYYVDVCDSVGDKYRFGFNNYEKLNEWSGIGNTLDFGARIYDSRLGRFYSLDPKSSSFPHQTPYSFGANNPIFLVDENGEAPKPNPKRINLFFTIKRPGEMNRAEMINHSAKINNVSAIQIALIVFRENLPLMSDNKAYYNLWAAKESIFAPAIALLNMETADRWSVGVTQLQMKHIIRLSMNQTVEEYDKWKDNLMKTKEGRQTYAEVYTMYYNEVAVVEEKAIDVLGKYVKELNDLNPGSTDEQIAKDYMRGPHNNRDPQKEESTQANEDWEIQKENKPQIEKILKDAEN